VKSLPIFGLSQIIPIKFLGMPFCHLFQLFLLRADSRWICKSILHLLQLNLIFALYFLFQILTIFSKFLCPIHFLFLFYASLKNEIYLHFYFVSPSSLFVIFIQFLGYHMNNFFIIGLLSTCIHMWCLQGPTGAGWLMQIPNLRARRPCWPVGIADHGG